VALNRLLTHRTCRLLLEPDKLGPLQHIPLRQARQSIFSSKKKDSPSTQGETRKFQDIQCDNGNFYACNRPPSREPKLPLTLLHPVFGDFEDNCKRKAPTASNYEWAKLLREGMCAFYDGELGHQEKLLSILGENNIPAQAAYIKGSRS
jgi:hypothetical protein